MNTGNGIVDEYYKYVKNKYNCKTSNEIFTKKYIV